jgi:hypothetical protein
MYLMLVWYGLQTIGGDDGEDGHDEGVGAPHYDGQPCAEQRLEQGVDAGGEDERLDDSGLVVLIANRRDVAMRDDRNAGWCRTIRTTAGIVTSIQ